MPDRVQYRQGRPLPPGLQVGGPEPLPKRVDGQEVFALAERAACAASRRTETPPAPAVAAEDLDRPIGVAEFAEIKGRAPRHLQALRKDSLNAWARGEDRYLPSRTSRCGPRRCVASSTSGGWAAPWRGASRPPGAPVAASPAPDTRSPTSGPSWPQPGPGERPTVREPAASLSERMGSEISAHTVRRLLHRERDIAPAK